ncbi:hypothetical protein SIN8267_02190 [Sinobacterium norvegicum]|uniref:DUF7802 domain-containing protein n=1 Tax=Sinobacterium norvegicum TaxID=1641715 RepID=A0ABM9AFU2_9GAMM|nr:hypothetical protein [Sinobacterium norvegicum]CAH0992075.1 hypothetical protein SIN8267_02190 [Sinobacterium norvegicum]
MSEHISYAMNNAEATNALVYFNSPAMIKDWSFLAIEWLLIIGFVLTVVHAIRYSRQHQTPAAIYTLVGALLYGLAMDIISYYTVENFWHGEFSVMFLYNRLPLYIALFYPTFMYHIYMTIRRFDFSPAVEAISAGFMAGTLYLIFDNIGPQLGWWIWDRADPSTLPYVDSVPLTSYHWFFMFMIAFAFIARKVCWQWPEQDASKVKLYSGIALMPITVIVLGSVLFIPYNLFSKGVPPWDMLPWDKSLVGAAVFHCLSFTAAGFVYLLNYRRSSQPRDTLLMIFPLAFITGHLYVYIANFSLFFNLTGDGLTTEGLAIGNLPAVLVAIVVGTAMILYANQPTKD